MNLRKCHKYLYKAQVSLELLFYVSAVLLMTISYVYYLQTRYDLRGERYSLGVSHLLNDVANMLEYVYTQGDGFYLNYTLPLKIENKYAYVIYYKNHKLLVDIGEKTYLRYMYLTNISGYFIPGRKHLIRNEEGMIYVLPY